MAARVIKSKRGLHIELWKTCFRVQGMARTLSIGPDFTDEAVVEFADAVFDTCQKKAQEKAVRQLQDRVVDFIEMTVGDKHG